MQRPGDEATVLSWHAWSEEGTTKVWVATTNEFPDGGTDHYLLMDQVDLTEERAVVPLRGLRSSFYKLVLETPAGFLNRWVVLD